MTGENCPSEPCADNSLALRHEAVGNIIELESIATEAVAHRDYSNASRFFELADEVRESAGILHNSRLSPGPTPSVKPTGRDLHEVRTEYND